MVSTIFHIIDTCGRGAFQICERGALCPGEVDCVREELLSVCSFVQSKVQHEVEIQGRYSIIEYLFIEEKS